MYILSVPVADVVCKTIFISILNAVHSEGETRRMEAVVQELKTDNEMQTKFLRFVYHEIRNPFNSIMLGLSHLEEEKMLLPYRELIVMLRRSATAMKQVIDDVVELTQARGMQLSVEPVSVKAVLESALETFDAAISDRAIQVQQNVSSLLPAKVLADSLKLKKVFEVLLSNALKFSPVGSTVIVSLQVVDITFSICTLNFFVKDKGPGIPDRIAPMLFQPFAFVRPGDFSEDQNRGSGLGLCFAKHLADLMNGTLAFKNNKETRPIARRSHSQNQGSTFSFTLALEICPPGENNIAPSWNYWTPRRFFPSSGSRGSVVSIASAADFNNFRRQKSIVPTTAQVVPHNLQISMHMMPPANNQALQSKRSSLHSSLGAKLTERLSMSQFLSSTFNSDRGELDTPASPTNDISLGTMRKGTRSGQSSPVNQRKHFAMPLIIPDSSLSSVVASEQNMDSVGRMSLESSLLMLRDYKDKEEDSKGSVHDAERNFPPSFPKHTARSCLTPVTSRQSGPQTRKNSHVTFETAISLEGQSDQRILTAQGRRISDAKNHHLTFPILTMRSLLDRPLHQFNPVEVNEDCNVQQEAQVLIVDDVKSNQKLVHLILQKAGYVCHLASDGQEAVTLARQNRFKLIIMDNVMPVMNGMEATRQILAFDKTIAIVGLTGNILQKDQQEFINAGVRFVIEKPVDKTCLLEVCKQFVPFPQR